MTTRKALLVGAGGMGKAWAKNLKAHAGQVEFGGWVDVRPDAAAQAANEFELGNIYAGTDLRRALDAVRPDFVVDVTVPEAHAEVTTTALGFGVPVIGEKPMATSREEARRMVAASEKAGKLYMVSQSRRYDARIHAYKQLIEQVAGGALGILNSDFYIGAHFGGFRDEMDSPLILDMAIHTLDAARYLSGADPVSVYCDEFNPPWSWYKGNAAATAIFEMTGGLRYTYRGAWCSEGRHTSWESEWRAIGPAGTATWDGKEGIVGDAVAETGAFHSTFEAHAVEPAKDMPSGIAGSLRDFLRALDDPAHVPMGECHDNIKSLAMVFAAIESARTGQRVAVDV